MQEARRLGGHDFAAGAAPEVVVVTEVEVEVVVTEVEVEIFIDR